MSFTFGRNWEDFIARNYSEERVLKAKSKLLDSLKLNDLHGMTFLDIGVGSGLHSLAAWKAGASQVVSFDLDEDCIKTAEKLAEKNGNPSNWKIVQGSILDSGFVESLGKFDIVYSWGVLHHTGDTYKAVSNAAMAMKDSSVFFVALYSYYAYYLGALWREKKYGGGIFPEEWLKIKEKYHSENSLPAKLWTELKYIYSYCLIPPRYSLKSWINLYNRIRTYKEKRGMAFMSDVRDWLGGWPMDFVKEDKFEDFCRDKLGLKMLCMNTGEGVTDFFLKKAGQRNYLEDILSVAEKIPLAGVLAEYKECTLNVNLSEIIAGFDFADYRSNMHRFRLYRNSRELYAFTGGLDGVLASTVECYNIIDGWLYYNPGIGASFDDSELFLAFHDK